MVDEIKTTSYIGGSLEIKQGMHLRVLDTERLIDYVLGEEKQVVKPVLFNPDYKQKKHSDSHRDICPCGGYL